MGPSLHIGINAKVLISLGKLIGAIKYLIEIFSFLKLTAHFNDFYEKFIQLKNNE